MDDALAELQGQIEDELLRRLLDDWDRWRGDRELPARRDFTPETIRYLLGDVILLDVEAEPLRFRYRLIGTNVTGRWRMDLTGHYLDQHPDPAFRALIIPFNRQIVETRRPARIRFDLYSEHSRKLINYEALHLPLSADGMRIDMLLCGIAFPRFLGRRR